MVTVRFGWEKIRYFSNFQKVVNFGDSTIAKLCELYAIKSDFYPIFELSVV